MFVREGTQFPFFQRCWAPDEPAAPAPATPPAGDPPPSAPPHADAPPATPLATPPADAPPATPPVTPPADGVVTPPVTPPAPEAVDWTKRREAMLATVPADVREKAGKVLAKYASEDAVVLALASADSKITELSEKAKGLVKVPGKDAKPEDVSAFDKAWGVPETADKYEIKRPDTYVPTELDKVFDAKAKDVFKGLHLNQEQTDAIVKLDIERQEMANQAMTKAVEQSAQKGSDALRLKWGVNEFQPQLEAINRYSKEVIQPLLSNKDTSFLDRRFADGTCLGEDPDFLAFMAQHVVNPWMDDNGIPRGSVPGGNASEDGKRKAEIMALMNTDRKRYSSKEIQDELDQILTRENVRGKSRAA